MNQDPMYPFGGMYPQSTPGAGESMKDLCKSYHLHLVQFQTSDGKIFDGIIEDIDDDGVDFLVPDGDDDMDRQFLSGYGGYGGPTYGFYGYPRRFRRFRRRRFPFYVIRRLFFPYFF